MLTRDVIMALPPEELNRAIWEALGWVHFETKIYSKLWHHPADHTEYTSERFMPDYAHSIEAAWELVEGWNNQESMCLMNLHYLGSHPRGMVYQCELRYIGESKYIVAEADTAPLAISRTWLIWKQEER